MRLRPSPRDPALDADRGQVAELRLRQITAIPLSTDHHNPHSLMTRCAFKRPLSLANHTTQPQTNHKEILSMTGFELFPEESKRQEDLSIREQYEQLLAREQAEQAAALDQRLSEINSSGDMSELLTSVQLKLSFISKFGATRYGALHAKHVKREGE